MVSSETFNIIYKQYEDIREKSRIELENRKKEIYKSIPRIKEIDDEISKLSIDISKQILSNPKKATRLSESLHKKNMDLKIEKSELLSTNGYPTDYLTFKYKCGCCKDTGFIENEKCRCFKQKLIDIAYKESNLSHLLKNQNFDTFDFSYYSDEIDNNHGTTPKENIQNIFNTCLNFSNNFDSISESLLFTGSPGLGKTFLSSCIAKDLLDRGKTVFYQTAFKIFDILEEYKFNKNKENLNRSKIDVLFDSDLVIIDDLGTEFINSYTASEFFNILNSRLLSKKKTIISTNLSLNEINKMYSERVFSRIIDGYKILKFFGEDIRYQKKISNLQ